MIRRVRTFLRDWVVPPKLAVLLARRLEGQPVTQVDPRRWWNGERLPAPAANVPLFASCSEPTATITMQQESRCCLVIAPGRTASVVLPPHEAGTCVLGVGTEGAPSISQTVAVDLDGAKVGELRHVTPGRWHDVRIELERGGVVSVSNHTAAEVFLCHPRISGRRAHGQRPPARNAIVLILDALTRDAFDSRPAAARTPNLHRFFSRGTTFSQAFAQSEWTLPSIYSMLTARYALDHFMVDPRLKFPSLPSTGAGTCVEALRAHGFATLGYSTAKVFQPAYNAHLGFDRFFYSPYMSSGLTVDTITRQAIVQLETNRDGRNFLLLHYIDSHEPWAYPTELTDFRMPAFRITDPFAEYGFLKEADGESKVEPIFSDEGIAVLNQRRDARLHELDLALDALFRYLENTGQVDDTIVALCADHGSSYTKQHRPLLHDDKVGVPLMLRGPQIPGGQDGSLVALNLDLMPTLMQWLDVPWSHADGRLMAMAGGDPRESILSESVFKTTYQIALRDQEFVYHFRCAFDPVAQRIEPSAASRRTLFLRREERECRDVIALYPDVAARFDRMVSAHLARFSHRVATAAPAVASA
jgi:arylsulfatase A-like enzyme